MQAFFLHGSQRELFAVYYPAKNGHRNKFILHIPAFAEEMNCSRHIVSQQCRAFSEHGYSVLKIDLLGTGDSSGDFSDATWAGWKQDVESACQWLISQGAEAVVFWGLRVGALLAMDCVANVGLRVKQLILWQPVLLGDQFVTQFLRLKTVAIAMDNKVPAVKLADLKQQVLSGQFIEVAGYTLNPELLKAMMQLNALKIDLPVEVAIALFEISNNNAVLSAKNVQFSEEMKRKQLAMFVKQVNGNPFWAAHGSHSQPELSLATLQCCL